MWLRHAGWCRRLAALATALIPALAVWIWWPRIATPRAVQFSFSLPEGQFTGTGRRFIDISPDGTTAAKVADSQIYLRPIDSLQSHAIQGSRTALQGLVNPLFSPDGQSIAFLDIADGALKRIPLSGGGAITNADLKTVPLAATWNRHGIFFSNAPESVAQDPELQGIFRVSPDGGVPERIVTLDRDESAATPQVLPDGRRDRAGRGFRTPVALPAVPRPQLRSGEPRGYDVGLDGRLVSVVQSSFSDGRSAGEIRVVLNWREELLDRVPVK